MRYPQPQVFVDADPELDRCGGAVVWAFGCMAVALAIGLPVWLMFFV